MLFPELQQEVAAARLNLQKQSKTEYFDQESVSYKDKCEAIAHDNMGKRPSKLQVGTFMQKVVRTFSCILWMEGCAPPRVKGFQADIRLKTDAIPKILQPYPLSQYDQLRLDLHEDQEVADGKARWSLPGETTQWGAPSFVVDSEGKGLLGRPVRDYRFVNTQTLDAAWRAGTTHPLIAYGDLPNSP